MKRLSLNSISSTHRKKTFAGQGKWGYAAEAMVEHDAKVLYVHSSYYMGENYSVADKSMFDFITGGTDEDPCVDFIEYYDDIDDMKESQYREDFCMLDKMVEELG